MEINDIISGVLDIKSKYSYGYNKKKVYKVFYPLNNLYQKFIIPYKDNNYTHNILIIAKINKIIDNNVIIAEIVEKLGILNTPNIDLYARSLLNYYNVNIIKNNNKLSDINILIEKYKNTMYKKDIKSLDFICNIDPLNCSDIDDIISFSKINNIKRIGIHITNIMETFKNLEIDYHNIANDIINNNMYNTIYGYNKKYNILNENIIKNFLSLDIEQPRNVISLYIDYDNDYNIIKYELIEEILINKITFTYEEAEIELIKSNKYLKYISEFCFNIGKQYLEIFNLYENHLYNSHYIISILMIIYNQYMGNILQSEKAIYRVCDNFESEYQFNNNCNYHKILNINNYLHFTSPIRRFVDQYNHLIYHKKYIDINIDKINIQTKNLKYLNNKFNLLNLINKEQIFKLLDYDIKDKNLYLKWSINNIIVIDIIYDANIIFIEKNINIINRLNISENLLLVKNNIYNLKITLELTHTYNLPKLIINYFSSYKNK